MSKAKWFEVRKPSTGGIIATSANQIVPLKFGTYKNVHQTPLSSCSVEGGSGDETRLRLERSKGTTKPLMAILAISWIFITSKIVAWKRASVTNFCWHFDWLLQSSSGWKCDTNSIIQCQSKQNKHFKKIHTWQKGPLPGPVASSIRRRTLCQHKQEMPTQMRREGKSDTNVMCPLQCVVTWLEWTASP